MLSFIKKILLGFIFMNSEKRNAIIVLVIALAFVGYIFFLTTKVQDSETQINELKASLLNKATEKKMASKFKLAAGKFCEASNTKSIIFDGKNNFELQTQGADTVKGNLQLEKNSIILLPSQNSQLELIIKSWDNTKTVVEFTFEGKTYGTTLCKTPEQEQQEKEKSIQESLEKERLENDKIEREKAEKERIERERAEKEKADKEKIDQIMQKLDKIEQMKTEQEKIEKEKAEQEKLVQEKLLQEKQEREKAQQERMELENVEKEKALQIQKEINQKPNDEVKIEPTKNEKMEEDELKLLKDKTN